MKHPALKAYENLAQRIIDNTNDVHLMPMGSGDIVGRARFEAELKKLGIQYPDNFINEMNWFEEIGIMKLARKFRLKFERNQKAKEAQYMILGDALAEYQNAKAQTEEDQEIIESRWVGSNDP